MVFLALIITIASIAERYYLTIIQNLTEIGQAKYQSASRKIFML
jgi:hypothetical protein